MEHPIELYLCTHASLFSVSFSCTHLAYLQGTRNTKWNSTRRPTLNNIRMTKNRCVKKMWCIRNRCVNHTCRAEVYCLIPLYSRLLFSCLSSSSPLLVLLLHCFRLHSEGVRNVDLDALFFLNGCSCCVVLFSHVTSAKH